MNHMLIIRDTIHLKRYLKQSSFNVNNTAGVEQQSWHHWCWSPTLLRRYLDGSDTTSVNKTEAGRWQHLDAMKANLVGVDNLVCRMVLTGLVLTPQDTTNASCAESHRTSVWLLTQCDSFLKQWDAQMISPKAPTDQITKKLKIMIRFWNLRSLLTWTGL